MATPREAIDALTSRAKQLQQEATALGFTVVFNKQGDCAVLPKLANEDSSVDEQRHLLELSPAYMTHYYVEA
jgi:hypothetical protein